MKVVKLPDLRVVYKVVQDTWHELKSCLLLKERYQKRADGASKSRCWDLRMQQSPGNLGDEDVRSAM